MREFVMGLPKAELHVHVEGTIEPATAFALAARNGVRLPWATPDELAAAHDFADLQSFLDVYYAVMAVLCTPADFADVADAYLARAAAQGVRHVEMFFDPQAHVARGLPIETVIDGLYAATSTARERHGLTAGLILCMMRDRPVDDAAATLAAALPHVDKLVGVGLDSAEVGYPPGLFAQVFADARAAGLHVVAHAGEEGPAEYVWEAIRTLHVERVDHGLRSLEDPALVAHLVGTGLPLTVCPFSTVRLRGCDTLADHPVARMLRVGLNVSVHSDDPAYFGGYVGDNLDAVRETLGLTVAELQTLAANSFRSSFLPADAVQAHLRGLDEYVSARAQYSEG
ncbi:Adenosine deaminase [Pseudonocardia dioxanivorans CB1190]|uniref:Adenine deaminase n=1 Tax=Pseudonocardia dioxanivorans (strain ATCC 55486 / DSM 44775 / JCM 13855 / CB1190) TaxID=675635 RepID=F4CKJ5_PSEUX|nr:adenosine deaminase [Pseudonocardia dioxanivorans]AEA22965.1 Adenosine deaminase [Pseudonocardia dioxanivorans CB1190]